LTYSLLSHDRKEWGHRDTKKGKYKAGIERAQSRWPKSYTEIGREKINA
jgi:hypothetical protein